MTFKFEIGQNITIEASGETGKIIGAALYLTGENSYLIRYKAADGRAVDAWWQESALSI